MEPTPLAVYALVHIKNTQKGSHYKYNRKEPWCLKCTRNYLRLLELQNSCGEKVASCKCTHTHQKHMNKRITLQVHQKRSVFVFKSTRNSSWIVRISEISWEGMLPDPLPARDGLVQCPCPHQMHTNKRITIEAHQRKEQSENVPELVWDHQNFKISWRRMPPESPSLLCACSMCLYLCRPYIVESLGLLPLAIFSVCSHAKYVHLM